MKFRNQRRLTPYLIFKCGSSKVLQTQLIAQSHEERTKLKVPVQQILVLWVVPCEHKLHGYWCNNQTAHKAALIIKLKCTCTSHLWRSSCPLQTGTSAAEASARPSVSAHSSVVSDWNAQCSSLQKEPRLSTGTQSFISRSDNNKNNLYRSIRCPGEPRPASSAGSLAAWWHHLTKGAS